MAAKTEITLKNYAKTLSSWKASGQSVRQRAQDIIEFGLLAFAGEVDEKHRGDTGFLTRFVATAREVYPTKTVDKTIVPYICECAPLTYGEAADGTKTFRKKAKEDSVCEILTRKWWEAKAKGSDDADKPKAKADVKNRIAAVTKIVEQACKGEREVTFDGYEEAISDLESAIAALKQLQARQESATSAYVAAIQDGSA
jgi:hypothetical protein